MGERAGIKIRIIELCSCLSRRLPPITSNQVEFFHALQWHRSIHFHRWFSISFLASLSKQIGNVYIQGSKVYHFDFQVYQQLIQCM